MEDKLQDEFTPNSQLIAKQVEEMIESAVKLQRQTLREKIEYMKWECSCLTTGTKHGFKCPAGTPNQHKQYNKALDSVLALIDNQENK